MIGELIMIKYVSPTYLSAATPATALITSTSAHTSRSLKPLEPGGETRREMIYQRRARGIIRNIIRDLPPAVPLSAAVDSASAAYLSLVVFVSASLRMRREAKT